MERNTKTGRILPGKNYDYAKMPEYHIWRTMIARCHNPKDGGFYKYGARGVKVCIRWRRSFKCFFRDMGPRPPNRSIDRIDNDGNYEPNNCRWATKQEQNYNKRNTVRVLGKTLKEWSKKTGMPHGTIKTRYNRGFKQRFIISKRRFSSWEIQKKS